MKKSYMQSRRMNYIVFAVLLVIVMFAGILLFSIRANAKSKGDPETGRVKLYTSVYIEEGDTLWSIAQEYISEEYGSINEYVDELKKMNHVGNNIHAGCYLTVSYYAEPGH